MSPVVTLLLGMILVYLAASGRLQAVIDAMTGGKKK